MRQCPVCDKDTSDVLCPVCGFDFSRDYEHNPTFAPTMSIAARRKAWQERLEANRQEQEWKAERDLTRVSLNAVENRCRQLTKENRELNDQLKDAQARAASAAENAELKAEYERKLEQAQAETHEAREKIAAVENELNQVRQELDSSSGHAPRKRRNLLLRCWDKYLSCLNGLLKISKRSKSIVESSSGISKVFYGISYSVILFSLYILFLDLSLLLLFGVMSIGHSALFHAPWSSAPCVVRDSCSYLICSPEDHHEWSDSVCLEPRTCTVCGASHGGTDSHVWEIADAGGTEQCILCDTERGAPSFAYVTTADESIHSGYVEGDTLTNVLTFDDVSLFPEYETLAYDYKGKPPIGLRTQKKENTLTLTFPDNISEGVYSVHDVRRDQLLATLYYCRPFTPFPCGQATIEGRFRTENLLTGQYLERSDAGYCTTEDYSFTQLTRTPPGEPYQYQYITRDGEWLSLYVFEDNGRCLAANSNGTVYWSSELTDECYWLIQEEAN